MLDRIQVGVHRRWVHCARGPVPPASRAEGARSPGARVHERGAHSGPLSYGPPPESYQAYMGQNFYPILHIGSTPLGLGGEAVVVWTDFVPGS